MPPRVVQYFAHVLLDGAWTQHPLSGVKPLPMVALNISDPIRGKSIIADLVTIPESQSILAFVSHCSNSSD